MHKNDYIKTYQKLEFKELTQIFSDKLFGSFTAAKYFYVERMWREFYNPPTISASIFFWKSVLNSMQTLIKLTMSWPWKFGLFGAFVPIRR